jgi:hypothetical protein
MTMVDRAISTSKGLSAGRKSITWTLSVYDAADFDLAN